MKHNYIVFSCIFANLQAPTHSHFSRVLTGGLGNSLFMSVQKPQGGLESSITFDIACKMCLD